MISTYLKEFAIELIILALTFSGGLLLSHLKRALRFRKFRTVFGKTVRQADNLFLCLPEWVLKPSPEGSPRFEMTGLGQTTREYVGPSRLYDVLDVKASFELSAWLGGFFNQSIDLIPDRESLVMGHKSGIFLGSALANVHVDCLLKQNTIPFVELIECSETPESPGCYLIKDSATGTVYDSSGEQGYALIIRLINPQTPDGYIFLVFGPHDTGTYAAATYLRMHWTEFINAEKTCALLLEIPNKFPEHVTVVKSYNMNRKR
jgi:hypothetical protein